MLSDTVRSIDKLAVMLHRLELISGMNCWVLFEELRKFHKE